MARLGRSYPVKTVIELGVVEAGVTDKSDGDTATGAEQAPTLVATPPTQDDARPATTDAGTLLATPPTQNDARPATTEVGSVSLDKASSDTATDTESVTARDVTAADARSSAEAATDRELTAADTRSTVDVATDRTLTADDTASSAEDGTAELPPIDKSDADVSYGLETSEILDQPGSPTDTTQVWATSQTNDGQSWTSPTACQGSPDATGAVSGVANGGTTWIQPAGFDTFSEIPAGSTINSLTVRLYTWENNINRWDTETAQLYVNGTPVGSTSALVESTSTSHFDDEVFTGTIPSLSDLQSGNLQVRVSAHRTSSSASTFTVDAVGVIVNYTPASGGGSTNEYGADRSSTIEDASVSLGGNDLSDGDIATTAELATDRESTAVDSRPGTTDAGTLAATPPTQNDARPATTDAAALTTAISGTDTSGAGELIPTRDETAYDSLSAAVESVTLSALLQSTDIGSDVESQSVDQGGTAKSGSDTGGSAEAAQIVVTLTAADAPSIIEAVLDLAAAVSGADSRPAVIEALTARDIASQDPRSDVEAFGDRTLTAADAATDVEFGSTDGGAALSGADTSSSVNAVIARDFTAADARPAVVEATVLSSTLVSADTGSDVEAVSTFAVSVAGSDIVVRVEGQGVTVPVSGADTAHGADSAVMSAAVSSGDTRPAIVEAALILVALSATDICTAMEALASLSFGQEWKTLSYGVSATQHANATTGSTDIETDDLAADHATMDTDATQHITLGQWAND